MLNELILSCSFQVTCSLCGSKPEPQIRTLKALIHIFNESSTIFQGIQHGIIWKKKRWDTTRKHGGYIKHPSQLSNQVAFINIPQK